MLMIGIVAHHKRRTQARALMRQVKACFMSVDEGFLGCDGNHEAVHQQLVNLPSTWSVVLEDDAAPVDGFTDQLHQALPMSPSPIVSFYLGRKRPPHWQGRIKRALAKADLEDASWLVATQLLHGVGYAIKTELLPSLLNHTSPFPVDQHIGHWARYHGHTIAYTNPSLVNHSDLPTLVEHPDLQPRTPGRTAWRAGTRDQWTTKAVTI